jgi:hypothetical protein
MVYADDVNLLSNNIDIIHKNTQTLTAARKKIGLEVNTGKTKHIAVLSPECRAKS